MTETDVQKMGMIVFCEEGGRIWRNNILNQAYARTATGDYKPVGKCGFGTDSADTIGIMFGRFFAIEFKSESGRLRPGQLDWLKMIVRHGGVAIVCRNADRLRALLQQFKAGELEEGIVHEC